MYPRRDLESRWQKIADELEAIAAGEQSPDRYPDDREASLLAEQDRIELAIGELDGQDQSPKSNNPPPEQKNTDFDD